MGIIAHKNKPADVIVLGHYYAEIASDLITNLDTLTNV